jgi:hypothetical protein
MGRKIGWLLSALVLAGTGVIGLQDAFEEWHGAISAGQKSATVAVGIYGILGVIAAIGLLMRRRWSDPLVIAWAVCVTYAATAGTIFYGGSDANTVGTIFAFLGAGTVASLVVWGARRAVKTNVGEPASLS